MKNKNIMSKKNEAMRQAKNHDELPDIKYVKIGTRKRDQFETKAQYFVISEMLKVARKDANMTQEQLAQKSWNEKESPLTT
jgi:ribosome-binding protein aMBF1 (putative translation factor)